jgi:putative ABC transport system permease protein
MIYDLGLAWRNIRHRPIETIIPTFVVSFAIALSVAVIALAQGAEDGIVQASDPFGVLVIGAAGSGQELVLSSILLQGNPIGNIPYDVYDELHHDDRVRLAVPLAFGDNVGGSRIIGTNHHFFELKPNPSAPPAFQLHDGRLFDDPHHHDHAHHDDDHDDDHSETDHHSDEHDHDHPQEAVLGWRAYQRLGLNIGDRFVGTHGVGHGIAENTHHEHPYTVVGILKPSGTAYDNAVYVSVESVWDAHAHEEAPISPYSIAQQEEDRIHNQVTAILILPTGFIEQNQIAQEFYLNPTLQAAFPGQELGNIIHLLNQGQDVLNVIGYLVLAIAGLTLFLSMYSAINARRSSIAVMRGLGSQRGTVVRMIVFETLLISILGSIIGRVLGYGIASLIGQTITTQATIPIPISFMPELEVLLWGLALGVGLLAGIIPAWMAYRVNVIENLFPS